MNDALLNSEQLCARLLEEAPVAMVLLDRERHLRWLNSLAKQLLGYEKQELLGRPIDALIALRLEPDNEDSHKPFVAISPTGAANTTQRLCVRRKDGVEIPVEARSTAIDLDGHNFTLATLADIAERRDAERSLSESEERFRLLVHGVRDYAIFMLDPQGHILSWNTGAERIKGYSASEIVGQHFSRFYPPEAIASGHPQNELAIATERGVYTEEGQRVRKNGTRFWAHVTITALRGPDGQLRGFAKVTRDVTERRRSEESLRRQAALIALSPDAILVRAMDGKILFWSRGAEALYGWSTEEAVGKPVEELLATEFPEPFAKRHQMLLETGFWSGELVQQRRGGQKITVLSRWRLQRDANGEPCEILETNTDISARKQAEEALRQAYAELELKVEARTRELLEANAGLQEFSYSVAHDLRAPLRTIQGFSQALLDDESPRLSPSGIRYAQNVKAGAARLEVLIRDLLAYGQLLRPHTEPQRVELTGLVQMVLEGLAGEIHERGADMSVTTDLPPVLAHWPTLAQVLVNLISNALKFVAPGVRPRVQVRASRREDRIRISVLDNGIGIAAQARERIFRPFERLHGEEKYAGTGIGLAIVRRGVLRMNGRIGVESTVGKGSEFWVELPAAD